MNRKIVSLIPVFMLSGGLAFGELRIYDGFSSEDYTTATTVNGLGGGTGWSDNWSVDTSGNVNNINRYQGSTYALDYTDSFGNSLVTTPGGLELLAAGSGAGGMIRNFGETVEGEVWFSFLNIRTSTQTFNYDLQFRDANGEIQFRIQNDGSGNFFRINQAAGGTSTLSLVNHSDDEFPAGQLFVGRATNVGSGAADSNITVWVNPLNLLDLSEGAAAMGSLTNRTVNGISQFGFIKGAATTGYFDELRIGSSSESVMPVPEPATWALWAGLSGLGFIAWRRRRS